MLNVAYSKNGKEPEIVSSIPLRIRYHSEGNRTRAASISPCGYCGKPVVIDNRRKTAYCSSRCDRLASGNAEEVPCANCGELFVIAKSKIALTKHGYNFCSRDCKDIAQSRVNEHPLSSLTYGDETNGYGWARSSLRADGCVSCGESKIHRLVIHHIDGDRRNNSTDNLECVCHNCHADRHVDESGMLNYRVLTSRSALN